MNRDNNIRISFNYVYPDEPVLVVFDVNDVSFLAYSSSVSSVHVRKAIVGKKAIGIYAELTGQSVEQIMKDAGVPELQEDK